MELFHRSCMVTRSRAVGVIGRIRAAGRAHQSTVTIPRSQYPITSRPAAPDSHRQPICRKTSSHPHILATRHLSTLTSQPGVESVKPVEPAIHSTFESKTGTWQYIVADASTSTAVIIDPVLDYDPAARKIGTATADSLLSLVKKEGYRVSMILETHVHADHLTAASYLQARLAQEQGYRPPIGVGERIGQVQQVVGERYGIPAAEYRGVFDRLFKDNEIFTIGSLTATAIHLPGHTPDHQGYKIGDHIFCGDSLFHVDLGTARCDFPGGSAERLFRSGRRLLEFPDHVKIWVGHDYPHEQRNPTPCMTVRDHKRQNKHLKTGVTEAEFVGLRKERDKSLAAPKLIDPSLQVNIRAGRLPKPPVISLPLELNGLEW
ncbi:MBL fold metallo-hydrolase [Aspergillus undulatus]|uniref:MBL fold metallo-hydrolase n=1 Tax=Aspergillus undulatus TaxID=1810928 RepID=UPI003CCE218D